MLDRIQPIAPAPDWRRIAAFFGLALLVFALLAACGSEPTDEPEDEPARQREAAAEPAENGSERAPTDSEAQDKADPDSAPATASPADPERRTGARLILPFLPTPTPRAEQATPMPTTAPATEATATPRPILPFLPTPGPAAAEPTAEPTPAATAVPVPVPVVAPDPCVLIVAEAEWYWSEFWKCADLRQVQAAFRDHRDVTATVSRDRQGPRRRNSPALCRQKQRRPGSAPVPG